MDCTFSNPVIYDGTTAPSTTLDTWNFKNVHCDIPTATPSAVMIASPAAYVDIASTSALAKGLTGAIEVNYAFDILMLITAAIAIGVWAFSHG